MTGCGPSLGSQPRGYFLDEYILVDGLGDVPDTPGSQRFLPITLSSRTRLRRLPEYQQWLAAAFSFLVASSPSIPGS